MPEDKAAAMARYPWYRRQVRRQLQLPSPAAADTDRASPVNQRRADEGVWAVVPDPESDPRWECYLQPQRQEHMASADGAAAPSEGGAAAVAAAAAEAVKGQRCGAVC